MRINTNTYLALSEIIADLTERYGVILDQLDVTELREIIHTKEATKEANSNLRGC